MKRALAAIFLKVACLCLAGCPHRVDFGKEGEIKEASQLLALTSAAEAQVFGVKGESKIRVDSPATKGVLTLFVAVTHPCLIHLESLDFFGKPTAVLVSDGQRFGLFQAEEGKYYRGPASPQNISRFLPVVMPPEELTALLLGRAPRIPAEQAELSFDGEAKAYRVILKKGVVTQTVWIHPAHHRVIRSEVRGVAAYDLLFENIERVGEVTYPRKVVLSAQAANTRLELLYKDVEVNAPPDLTLYALEPPAQVPIVEVDALGNPTPAGAPGP